jgi:hypothetical protein
VSRQSKSRRACALKTRSTDPSTHAVEATTKGDYRCWWGSGLPSPSPQIRADGVTALGSYQLECQVQHSMRSCALIRFRISRVFGRGRGVW